MCWSLDRNEYEISLLPVLEKLVFDTRSYLKVSCDQVISSWYERENYNTTRYAIVKVCGNKRIRLLIDLVPFKPIFTAIGKQFSDRVSWYVVVVYCNLQIRTRKNALFVSL